jgi:hypothetical protein
VTEEVAPLRCRFCGKSQHEVRKLLAGTWLAMRAAPTEINICNECVEIFIQILASDADWRNEMIERLREAGPSPDDGENSN